MDQFAWTPAARAAMRRASAERAQMFRSVFAALFARKWRRRPVAQTA